MAADDPLITLRELGVWARQDIDPTDTFAKLVIRMASALVREAARQPTWTIETAPVVAKLYTGTLALRTYLNPPEGEVASGIGPLTSRLVDSVAETMRLTDEEQAALADYAPASTKNAGKRLWMLGPDVDKPAPVVAPVIYLRGVDPRAEPIPMGAMPEDGVMYGEREPVLYDAGRIIPDGVTTVINASGRPEQVLRPEDVERSS